MSQLNNKMFIFYLVEQEEKIPRHLAKNVTRWGTDVIGPACIAKFNEILYWL